jgi:hypothetical protein
VISRPHFRRAAGFLPITIGGVSYKGIPKEYKTGSLGWMVSEKAMMMIEGEQVKVQIGLNITIIGSKFAKE